MYAQGVWLNGKPKLKLNLRIAFSISAFIIWQLITPFCSSNCSDTSADMAYFNKKSNPWGKNIDFSFQLSNNSWILAVSQCCLTPPGPGFQKLEQRYKDTNTKQMFTVWQITSTEGKVVDLGVYVFWSLCVLIKVTCAEEAPLFNKLLENEEQYARFTVYSCYVVGKHRRWKSAVWSSTGQITKAVQEKHRSSWPAEVKAIQVALGTAEWERWPVLYTDSRMVANILWGWLH